MSAPEQLSVLTLESLLILDYLTKHMREILPKQTLIFLWTWNREQTDEVCMNIKHQYWYNLFNVGMGSKHALSWSTGSK